MATDRGAVPRVRLSSGIESLTSQVGDDLASSSSLFRRAGLSFLGGTLAGLLGLALTLVIGRGYGPVGSGVFFATVAVVMVLSNSCELGVDTGFVWFLPRLRHTGRADQQVAALRIGLIPVAAAAVGAAVTLWLVAYPLGSVMGSADDFAPALRIGATAVIGGTLATVFVSATRGFGRLAPFVTLQNIALPGIRVITASACVAMGASVSAALIGWAASWWIIAVLAAWLVFRFARPHHLRPHSGRDKGLAHEFWAFSAPRALAGIVEIALVWLDVILVSILIGPAEAGIYAVASRFVTTGTLGENALRIALAPRFSALFAVGNTLAVIRLMRGSTPLMVAFSWPIFLVAGVYASDLMSVFGTGFDSGAPALRILCLAMLVVALLGPIQPVLLMSGRTSHQLLNKSLALAVQVIADLILIPRLGIAGAALAWTLAVFVDNGLAAIQLWRTGGVRVDGAAGLLGAVLVTVGAVTTFAGVWAIGLTGIGALLASACGTGAWVLLLLIIPRSPISLSRGLKGDDTHA